MTIKTDLHTLVDDLTSLRIHVRDTGETKYAAILHQADMLADTAAAELAPPTEATEAMVAAGITAMANMPANTAAAEVVAGVLRAGLLAARGA
ncbi:hypothetical protein [Cupriavidus basilensis]|uniref:hypothetical protein n=1 Tax=Cupriavidus basilensis TaxID=68895 RepID=UPI0007511DD8|nr:hypothetical protein [Cupriavidus basilensis]